MLEATAAEISALTGGTVIVAPADVRDPDAVAKVCSLAPSSNHWFRSSHILGLHLVECGRC